MYSHGSSARIGIGKRGHGGKEYKPPPERKSNTAGQRVPPPLKECNCLVQLDLAEYSNRGGTTNPISTTSQSVPSRRLHRSFRGGDPTHSDSQNIASRRKTVHDCEHYVRSSFGAHLVIPGRNQCGPVAIVGRTWHDAVPATAYVLQQLDWTTLVRDDVGDPPDTNSRDGDEYSVVTSTTSGGDGWGTRPMLLNGRIQLNVKDPHDSIISGVFLPDPSTFITPPTSNACFTSLQPWWIFQSSTWTVLACRVTLPGPEVNAHDKLSSSSSSSCPSPWSSAEHISTRANANTDTDTTTTTTFLQTCVDNVRFRWGNDRFNDLEMFISNVVGDDNDNHNQIILNGQAIAFAGGNRTSATILFQEIVQASSPSTETSVI
jgi:hypothetical protein